LPLTKLENLTEN